MNGLTLNLGSSRSHLKIYNCTSGSDTSSRPESARGSCKHPLVGPQQSADNASFASRYPRKCSQPHTLVALKHNRNQSASPVKQLSLVEKKSVDSLLSGEIKKRLFSRFLDFRYSVNTGFHLKYSLNL